MTRRSGHERVQNRAVDFETTDTGSPRGRRTTVRTRGCTPKTLIPFKIRSLTRRLRAAASEGRRSSATAAADAGAAASATEVATNSSKNEKKQLLQQQQHQLQQSTHHEAAPHRFADEAGRSDHPRGRASGAVADAGWGDRDNGDRDDASVGRSARARTRTGGQRCSQSLSSGSAETGPRERPRGQEKAIRVIRHQGAPSSAQSLSAGASLSMTKSPACDIACYVGDVAVPLVETEDVLTKLAPGSDDGRQRRGCESCQRMFESYARGLDRRPLVYKCATSAVIGGLGDIISQGVMWAVDGETIWHDANAARQTAAVALDGLCFNAPILHFTYEALERAMPTTADRATACAAMQVAVDILVIDPAYALLFLLTTGLLEGKSLGADILPSVRRNYPTLVAWLMVLGLLLAIPRVYLFKRFSLKWRVLISDIADLLWTFAACLVISPAA